LLNSVTLIAYGDDMPLNLPDINPILVQIGPLAIRWYALAYIAGIVAGWL
jgi:phosphatidylglycerol:prolipoprotein diacylglycerol transferase